jgi:hypothetical protein
LIQQIYSTALQGTVWDNMTCIKHMCDINPNKGVKSMEMTSCQITGICRETWIKFRQRCIGERVSVNQKIRGMIEAEVFSVECGGESNMCQGVKGEQLEKT